MGAEGGLRQSGAGLAGQAGWQGDFKARGRRRPSAQPRAELAGSAFSLLFQLLQLPE